jgi:hypothetical protein
MDAFSSRRLSLIRFLHFGSERRLLRNFLFYILLAESPFLLLSASLCFTLFFLSGAPLCSSSLESELSQEVSNFKKKTKTQPTDTQVTTAPSNLPSRRPLHDPKLALDAPLHDTHRPTMIHARAIDD